jgi:Bacterial archaeo-eukaryotic release factor family 7
MDILNPAGLKSLIAQQGKWCVSIFMPTHRAGRDQQQDPIRLKNLLAQAETKLLANGLRRPAVQRLMRPAEELLWSKDFWQHQAEGLAIFLTNNFHRIYRLPVEFDEFLSIGTSFHFKPLVPCLGRGIKFYVLALSLKDVRLFEGNADTIHEVQLNFPTSMEEVLWADEPERYLNLHSGSTSLREGKGGGAIFHGHTPQDDEKKDILRFFQAIDEGLNDLLQEESIPVVLAGVEYLLPIFREASSYQNLLEDRIAGNHDRENLKQLHKEAWNIVLPIFEESQRKAFEKFEQLNGQKSPLAVKDIKEAVKAAVVGQVETIFVPLGVQKWGRYDPENHRVILKHEPKPEDEDLFDFAATQTLLNSGQVFAVPPEQIPGGGEVAATLRYAA